MNKSVEFLLCNVCKKQVIGIWKDPLNQGQDKQQEYVHRKTLSAFCDYNQETIKEGEVKTHVPEDGRFDHVGMHVTSHGPMPSRHV